MRKLFSLCVIVALFMMMGCALLKYVGQPQLQTYTFIFDGGEYSALLPKEVPLPPEDATKKPMWYPTWGLLYAIHISYFEPDVDPILSLWFTKEAGVVGLVYHVTVNGKEEHKCYIYLKGLPIKIDGNGFNLALRNWISDPKQ